MYDRDVLMSSRRLHSCLSYAVHFREALVSGEMYSVRGETFPMTFAKMSYKPCLEQVLALNSKPQ